MTGLNSCRSCKSKGNNEQKQIEMEDIEDFKDELEQAIYPLPNSADVIRLLTELEVGYMVGVSNSVDNVNNYITSVSRAINLGIYGADLSYATLYNMNQDVINFLDAIRALASDLHMSRLYDRNLYDNIKTNFDDKDKLVELLSDAFNGTYGYLTENDQQPLALMVVAGAWVEGMYITTNISNSVYHVEGISRSLLDQKKSFELFLEIAEPHADDPVVKDILDAFQPIKEVYEGIDTSLTLTNVEDLTRVVAEVRESFTK
jgi:hypothetical protein